VVDELAKGDRNFFRVVQFSPLSIIPPELHNHVTTSLNNTAYIKKYTRFGLWYIYTDVSEEPAAFIP
jgi:hypothetical protein